MKSPDPQEELRLWASTEIWAMAYSVFPRICFGGCLVLLIVSGSSAQAAGSNNATSANATSAGSSNTTLLHQTEQVDANYIAHGWLMWAAFGLLFPSGLLAAKYGQKTFAPWFLFHRVAQVLGVTCGTIGVILAFTADGESGEGGDSDKHVAMGFLVAGFMWAAVLLGLIRPKKGATLRPYWYLGHWFLGTASILVGWYNIFEGLEVVEANQILHTLFWVEIALFTLAYLFLDRWEHLLSQRTLPNQTQPVLELPDKV